ncbi:MAG: D-arabinono-1,4-lactone oxidase [Ilumatobacteraceae bacterium]
MGKSEGRTWRNWAGNQRALPITWHTVRSSREVVERVSDAVARNRRVKVVGSGHSFTAAAVADDVLIDLRHLDGVGRVDEATCEVEVDGGVTIAALNEALAAQGWALANLGDIAYQSIAGAISTSTHGTGVGLTGIAGQVVAISLVDGCGIERRLTAADGDVFRAAVVGVGALGVITSVRLRVVPSFVLAAVEKPMRLDAVIANLEEFVATNDHFEFFWIPHTDWAITKRNNRFDGPASPMPRAREWWQKSFLENTAFGAVCRLGRAVPSLIPRLATALPGSGEVSYSNVSYKVFASPRRVRFVEMEYALPREACADALTEVRRMIDAKGLRISFPVEVRFTAPDDLLLSTAQGRDSAYIAVHMYKGTPFDDYFRSVEAIMRAHGGRPHWGKMHYLGAADLAPLYPDWETFLGVRKSFDPTGTFVNDYVRRIFDVHD